MNDRLAELRRGAASPDQVALEIDDNGEIIASTQ